MKINRLQPIYFGASCIICILCFLTGFRSARMDATRIIEAQQERQRIDFQVTKVKMVTLDREGNIESREVLRAERTEPDGSFYSVFRLLSPEDVKGVTLLNVTKEGKSEAQVLYMPALGGIRKIAGKSRKGYFLGTDFAYEDLLPMNKEAFEFERLLDERIDGSNCYRVTAKPINREFAQQSGYRLRELFIRHQDNTLVKVDLFGRGDEPIKTLKFSEFTEFKHNGRTTIQPIRAQMMNHEKQTSSLLVITHSQFESPPPLEIFNEEGIQKWSSFDDETLLGSIAK